MPKRYNIKWRDTDEKTLANAVRKFNAKRTRLLKQVPELVEFLPEKLNTKTIKADIKTRSEFNAQINSIERFMKKGAEKTVVTSGGVKTTVYEKKELEIKLRTVNRKRAMERKKADVSTTKGTMGAIKGANLKPLRTSVDEVKKERWASFVKKMERQSRESYASEKNEQYKANYITAIDNVFGEYGAELKARVSEIPAEALVEMYYNDPILQIDYPYGPKDMQEKIDTIMLHLDMYAWSA